MWAEQRLPLFLQKVVALFCRSSEHLHPPLLLPGLYSRMPYSCSGAMLLQYILCLNNKKIICKFRFVACLVFFNVLEVYFLFCCFLSQSAGILLFSTETMNATCTQNRSRKCKPTDPQQKQSWRTFCLNSGSKEVLPYCASEEVKWTDFKMHYTIQLQPWELCAGDFRTAKSLARLE